ncbi:PREDICTED: cell wall protein RBR3-like [Branchiostoma belcheri]|uniref:Cell wall protein RBR3-like n=1 Tax=Branchiostoma belcheri TaxID=7741 RepID=A0A6P4YD10_BRABE|nr:PREDICTED: cell wall protein RBR3-like [Branchiostoma belcheri]
MTRHFALVLALTLLAGAVYPAKSVPAQEQRPNDGRQRPDSEKAKVLLEELEELLEEEGMANNNGGSDVDEMARLPEKRDPEPTDADCLLKTTDTTYEYQWDLPQLTGTRFTFQVSTNSDAHIGLSPANQDATDMYEIVLGGWGNTKSAIRRGKLGSDVTNVDTPAINSPTEYRTFWINLASDGTISVGKGGESLPFMSWTDPNPIRVSYAGYSTGWGSDGRWKFCSETGTTQASTTVGTTEVVATTPTVQCDNPTVLNGNSGSFTSPGYPGNYPNNAYCTWQISVSTSDVVTIRFTEFSLEYNRNCGFDSLVVHDGPDATAPVLVTLCGSSARTVTTTGNSAFLVFTSDGSVTRSGFVANFTSELHCSMTMLKTTDTTYEYRWDLPQRTGTRFTFQVSANSDAHIGLSPANQDATDMYEIVLGGWGNTKSAIRRGKLGSDVTNVDTPAINSPTEYRTFWINLASDGTISVGKGGESLPFMSWTDPNPIRVSYAGYSTGWGSDGRWKFCSETGTSTKRMSEVRETDGKDNGEHKVEVVENGKQQPIKGQDGMRTGRDPEETLETEETRLE